MSDPKPFVGNLPHEDVAFLKAIPELSERVDKLTVAVHKELDGKNIDAHEIPEYEALAAKARYLGEMRGASAIGENGHPEGTSRPSGLEELSETKAEFLGVLRTFKERFAGKDSELSKGTIQKVNDGVNELIPKVSGRLSPGASDHFSAMVEHTKASRNSDWRRHLDDRERAEKERDKADFVELTTLPKDTPNPTLSLT